LVNNTAAKTIGLTVTHVPQSLAWKGDGSVNAWDTDTTENWLQSGTAAYFFTGDSVTFTDTGSDNPAIDITAAVSPAVVTVNAVQSSDFTGAAIATGELIKNNTGTLTLENNNTYAGPTVISGGVLQVGGSVVGGTSGTLGAGAITNNGALVFDLAQSYAVKTNIYGTGSLTNIGSAGTVTLSGGISGSGGVYMEGSGSMALSGSNSYTGPTIVASGTLNPENNHALGAGTASTVVSNGAQLYIDIPSTITNKPLVLAGTGPSSNGALRAGGGGVTTISGLITVTADVQFQVDGNSTLNLTNTAGINAPGINVTLGADSGGSGNITGPLSLGAGALTVQDAGTWTIAPTNNFTGLTVINGGTLDISGTNTLGPISAFNAAYVTLGGGILGVTTNVTFADGLRGFTLTGTAGGFDVGAGATLVISNQITGGGTLTKSDSGTLILSGSNTFTGTLDVDSGANALNDGVMEITASNAIATAVSPIAIRNSLGGASTFELNPGANGTITLGQDITLNGRTPSIPAILNATGTNTLAGNLTCAAGGGQYQLESDSGLLTLGGAATTLTFTTADPQTFTFQGNGAFAVAGVIADGTAATSVQKNGAGSLTLAAVNTYTGSTTATGGVLNVSGTLATGPVTLAGGTLAGTGIIGGPVTVGAGATFAPGAPTGTLTLGGTLSLAGTTLITVNGSTVSGKVAGVTSVSYGGTLAVTNVGGPLFRGNSFPIFPAVSYTGNFSSISPTPGAGLAWSFNPASGILSVINGTPGGPTNFTATASNGILTLTWPPGGIGWTLQAQTNSLSVGLATNWVDVAGSAATNVVKMPMVATNQAVFFRLRN
jgi:autotransporter-associated beta strand protein